MTTKKVFFMCLSLGLLSAVSSCKKDASETQTTENTVMSDNVLLQDYQGLYGGVPAFDQLLRPLILEH